MQDSFTAIDLIMGLLALFLGYKIYTILGRRTGEEKEQKGPLWGLSAGDKEGPVSFEEMPLMTGIKKIQQHDPTFSEASFLEGAKGAFEMILRAFLEGDLKTLKPFVSQSLWDQFDSMVKERAAKKHEVELAYFRIISANILESDMVSKCAEITVLFKSEQTLLVREGGTLIEGDPDTAEPMQDIWTFRRRLEDKNPNWILEALRSPGDEESL